MSVKAEDVLNDTEVSETPEPDKGGEGAEPEIDYDHEAKEMGWNPEYSGPNKKTAKEYYEDGLKIQPILQANLKKERAARENLEVRLREQETNSRKSIEALQKHYERELATVQAKKEAAVKNADVDEFKKLEAEEKELLKSKPEIEKEEKDFRSDPVIQQWEKDNSWYGVDEELTDYADFYSTRLRKKSEKSGRDFLDLVAEGVKKQFPGKFQNPRKQNFSAAAPSSRSQPAKTASFDSLPSSAKRDFEYAVNRKLVKDTPESRTQFAKDWAEAE